MKRKTALIIAAATAAIIILIICIAVFGRGCESDGIADTGTEAAPAASETETTAVPVTESESETEIVPEETLSDWDRATTIWNAGTELRFELRVKPGFEYELMPDEDNLGCAFTHDGKTVHILIQGMDYENTFETLVMFFKSLHPEKLSVGENTKTIIAVYDGSETEICSKITDMHCLT
ncbi:MAG: hypothetical protein J5940_01290, partial [Clostridia bacterium]|nr:hypothetical protein [Clostridia bacterium]